MASSKKTEYYTLTSLISSKEIQSLDEMLKSGAVDVNQHYQLGTTALMYAAELGSVGGIQSLVENGANLNARDNARNTAIIKAAQCGRLESIKNLVNLGAQVNVKNCKGETALNIACQRGDFLMTKYLVEAGANVNSQTNDGATPLVSAVRFGCFDIIKFLIDNKGANLTVRGSLETPLTVACEKEDANTVQLLVKAGCDVNPMTTRHGTALINASEKGSLESVECLISAGANLEGLFNHKTALMAAAENGHLHVCQCLIIAGAKVNATNRFGATALMSASVKDHVDIVKLLLQYGAVVDHIDKNGETALLIASYHGSLNVVKTLIESDANVHHLSVNRDTLLTIAAAGKATCVLHWLLNSYMQQNKGRCPDVNYHNKVGDTALIIAARQLNERNVECLLQAGADSAEVNSCGATALQTAIGFWNIPRIRFQRNNEETCPTIDLLINKGNCTGADLHYSISAGKYHIVKRMVEQGMAPYVETIGLDSTRTNLLLLPTMKLTPFSSALLKNQTSVAKYFALKCFFHIHDLSILPGDSDFHKLLISRRFSAAESLSFLKTVFSRPWTLSSLSFVAVSNLVGSGPMRKERIAGCGLPALFQRRLLFSDEDTNVSVSEWSTITLNHLHGHREASPDMTPSV